MNGSSSLNIPQFTLYFMSLSSPTEERDEYDEEFDRMREANLKTRQVQAKEEYSDAVKNVDRCRKNLATAREQVGRRVGVGGSVGLFRS